MPDLRQERGNTQPAFDLEPRHRVIQCGHKNAGNWAGVREDLQQLLRSDRHRFLQAKKIPLEGGYRFVEWPKGALSEIFKMPS
jgi:hypothetical protein